MIAIATIAIRIITILAAMLGTAVAIASAIEVGRGYAALFAANLGTPGCRHIAVRGIMSTAMLAAIADLGIVLVVSIALCWGAGWGL